MIQRAVETFSETIEDALDATCVSVVGQLEKTPLGKSDDAADDNDWLDWLDSAIALLLLLAPDRRAAAARMLAEHIAGKLDLGDLQTLATDATTQGVADDTVSEVAAELGVDLPANIVAQVRTEAVAGAKERAAELVGLKVLYDGSLIPDPTPEASIIDSTRNMLGAAIAEALGAGLNRAAIIVAVPDLPAFGAARAATIAENEIAVTIGSTTLAVFKCAEAAGVAIKKTWRVAPGCCDICLENQEAGPIDLGERFPSGAMTTPEHVNCRCGLGFVIDQ